MLAKQHKREHQSIVLVLLSRLTGYESLVLILKLTCLEVP
jgi:hypothetical protein